MKNEYTKNDEKLFNEIRSLIRLEIKFAVNDINEQLEKIDQHYKSELKRMSDVQNENDTRDEEWRKEMRENNLKKDESWHRHANQIESYLDTMNKFVSKLVLK